MATFWTFLLFVLLLGVANCVELESLCASDTFVYKGYRVNSFQRLRLNVTYEALEHYLIKSTVTCDPSQFKNKTNFIETLKLKNQYNRRLAQLYTKQLSGATVEELSKHIDELCDGSWLPLRGIYLKEEDAECLFPMQTSAYSGVALFDSLYRFFQFNQHPGLDQAAFKPTPLESTRWLDELMDKFKKNTDGPTFAFGSEEAWRVLFHMRIVLPREFKFLSEGPARPDTKSSLTYEMFLPFQRQDTHVDNDNCVSADDLPLFYKKKGKDN